MGGTISLIAAQCRPLRRTGR